MGVLETGARGSKRDDRGGLELTKGGDVSDGMLHTGGGEAKGDNVLVSLPRERGGDGGGGRRKKITLGVVWLFLKKYDNIKACNGELH